LQFTGLRIAGFKSFVDPTEVQIEEGLTGIVGPNGCGKSNLLEALRWAMGATSARAMRGGEMDDLIFSGTETRPAREVAEVTLLLDNSQRTAPTEFNDEDMIEIRRTLRRGAGSSYRINGRTVRAKDVQILFADASTGANSPALVRQGQISELIGAKPQNRRRILEEAAGIGGLAARRHEAELKLKGAEENLDRLAEIMAEVERQAASLKRQVGKARRYKALSEQITALEARLAAARWRGAVNETLAAREALAKGQRAVDESISSLAQASASELNARSELDPLRAAEADAAGRLGALRLALARLEAERDAARETLQRLNSDIARLEQETVRENAQRDDATARAGRAAEALALLPPDDPELQAREEQAVHAALEQANADLAHAEGEFDSARAELARAEAAAAAAASELKREQDRLDRLIGELRKAEADLTALGDPAKLSAALEAARAAHGEAEARARAAAEAASKATQAADHARAEEQRLLPPVHDAERRVRELEAERQGLERLLGKAGGSAHPPVMDQIRAAGLERALAAALDADLDAPADESAPAHWSTRHGRSAQPLPSGALPLCDLIPAPGVLRARLSQCGLVPRDQGEAMQVRLAVGQRLVSQEGDLWRWDGFVRRSDAPLPAAVKLEQRSRRTRIEAELREAAAVLGAVKQAHARAAKAAQDAESEAMRLRRDAPDAVRDQAQAREAVLKAEQEVERLQLRSGALQEAVRRITADREAAETAVASARSTLASAPADNDRNRTAKLHDAVRSAREAEREALARIDALNRERERAASTRASLIRDRDEWTARADNALARLADLQREGDAIHAAYEKAAKLPEAIAARLDAIADDVATADERRAAAADAFAEAEAALREADLGSRAARDKAGAARETLVRSEARLEAAIRREAEIGEQARANFNKELDALEALVAEVMAAAQEAQAQKKAKPIEESEEAETDDGAPASDAANALDAHLSLLRRTRDNLGAVNMEADEQLQEIAGRMNLQIGEREDLVAAIARLREGVDTLNQEGRSRLLDAFEQVNRHFKSLFVALFEGGEAELRLTESEDPLDAGLEIYASPPGKRLGQLSLMSGGEQALTATALIFAVFLTRPSPLCVLDEVDAPLDDANVDRFCRLLDEMRRRTETRFIIITHNAVSMSRMDRLFGVTMQERGVSRLVSVDLEAAERLAAA
jgi:chromosome segregation protein